MANPLFPETPVDLSRPMQVRLADISAFLERIGRGLTALSRPEDRWIELFESGVVAECAQCGIRLSGADLTALARKQNGTPKLARLYQGYCARSGCESHYYLFSFRDSGGIQWREAFARAGQAEEPQAEAPHAAEAPPQRSARFGRFNRNRVRLAIGIFLLLTLLAVRHWRNGGSIPFIREVEEIKADPASLHVQGECPYCGAVH